jgi:acetoin utilization deacetylase AcuC-like enzyme
MTRYRTSVVVNIPLITNVLFRRNFPALKALVTNGADVSAKCHATPVLHLALRTAAQPGGDAFGIEAFLFLLENGANPHAKDENGLTVLHLAALYNQTAVIDSLISSGNISKLVNSSPRLTGVTALHLSAASDSLEVTTMLLKHGVVTSAQLVLCKSTPLHTAASCKSLRVYRLLIEHSPQLAALRDIHGLRAADILTRDGVTIDSELQPAPRAACTLIVTSAHCLQHHSCAPSQLRTAHAPPENLRRLLLLVDEQAGSLRSRDLRDRLSWISHDALAPISDVLRVHEWTYARQVQRRCEGLDADAEADSGRSHLDPDTVISHGTYRAALGAAGAVCRAIDEVLGGRARNAFCPVRPPGHHAGPRGVVKSGGGGGGGDSHGFCIFNNVSVGAAYALSRHRDQVRRVAIVDFDVHHGNGTEETVRWLQPVLEEAELRNDLCFGKLYSAQYKPWLGEDDSSNVLFVSVHGYGPRERGLEHLFPSAAFYPGTGPTQLPRASAVQPPVAAAAVHAQMPAPSSTFSPSSPFCTSIAPSVHRVTCRPLMPRPR